MRSFVLIACTSIVLAGCGKKDSAEQGASGTQNVSAQSFDSRDATSIDAATGADANFAEDVELTVNDLEEANLDTSEGNAAEDNTD
jgi:major membrane immunogen (membrane-anchored lipoprotein)